MAISKTLYSSRSDEWETPQWLFDKLNKIFHFTLDACATPENAKCERYFTKEIDGLSQEWDGVVWCNPPYGRDIGKWVKKAAESSCTVAMLIPARTDTKWFHEWVLPYAEIVFIRGRLVFGDAKASAPFPSMIAVYNHSIKQRWAKEL